MKYILLLLLPALVHAQTPVARSSISVQAIDQRVQGAKNMIMPRYPDTATANAWKGLDSLGAHFLNTTNHTVYVRDNIAGSNYWLPLTSGLPASVWGAITGTLSSQTDLQTALNAKQNTIALGTTAQYFKGNLSLGTFPTDLASFTNSPGYLAAVTVQKSVAGDGNATPLSLVNDAASPGANQYYGTNSGGTKGYNLLGLATVGQRVMTDPTTGAFTTQAEILHQPVKYATTGALAANTYANGTAGVGATLTGNSNGALASQDGQSITANDRILVKNEVTTNHNGIYLVTQVGDGSHPYILTRGSYSSIANNMASGSMVYIQTGTTLGGQLWGQTTTGTITFGTTALVYAAVSGGGGSTPNLDAVLAVGGNFTADRTTALNSHKWSIGGIGSIHILDPAVLQFDQSQPVTDWIYYRPSGYNGTTKPGWEVWSDTVNYDPAQPANVVGSPWSSNFSPGGTRRSGSSAAFAYKTELNYYGSFEFHWPEIITTGGVNHRLSSMYVNQATGVNDWQQEFGDMKVWSALSAHSGNPWYELTESGNVTSETLGILLHSNFKNSASAIKFMDSSATGTGGTYMSIERNGVGSGLLINTFSQDLFISSLDIHLPFVNLYDQTDNSGTGNVTYYGPNVLNKGFVWKGGSGAASMLTLNEGGAQFFEPVNSTSYVYGGTGLYGSVGITSTGYIVQPYKTISSTYSVSDQDYWLNCTSGTFTATLPTASLTVIATPGYSRDYHFKNTGVGVITIAAFSGETIDGASTATIAAGGKLWIKSNGSNGWISY